MKTTKPFLVLAALALGIGSASAHRFWILPSSTVLSGDEPWVTFDAAVSNNLFFADHHAPEPGIFKATGPDGKPAELRNAAKGRYRSTFDLKLEKPGTYKIFTVRELMIAEWKENGKEEHFRGSAAEFEEEGIAKKPGVEVRESISRVETYVTNGEPNKDALQPTGKGLEIVFEKTAPNDLFAGETATFVLHMNGKPAAGIEVTTIPGGDRYRSESGEITTKTNDKGEFEVKWPEAGRYWMNASVKQEGEDKSKPARRFAFTGVFEVLPE